MDAPFTSLSERDDLHRQHPVHRRSVRVTTTATQYVFDELRAAVECRRWGLTFVARPRAGLSTALQLGALALIAHDATLPVGLILAGRHKNTSDGPFWASIASQLAPRLTTTRHPDELKNRLAEHLVTRVLETANDRVLLIVDRAHDLTSHQLSLLTELQDSLNLAEVRLTLALGGHAQLLARRDELYQQGVLEPYRRLFDRTLPVSGAKSPEDLAYFLESFDTTHFPEGTGPTYAQFYFPEAYARGWRLHGEASRLWSAFVRVLEPYDKVVDVEMDYVSQTVCSVLDDAFRHGSKALPPSDDRWEAAARASGVLTARVLQADAKKSAKS